MVSLPDTVKVKLFDGMGCNIQRNTILQISKPVIDVAHDAYQIMKGESVQLSVTGGAAYSWTPASGLSDPHTFNPIYNREGNQVYNTKDISEAVNSGWNGTAGGVEQPAGVYYWNVRGETGTGKNLQLNGKDSGSIVLVR